MKHFESVPDTKYSSNVGELMIQEGESRTDELMSFSRQDGMISSMHVKKLV